MSNITTPSPMCSKVTRVCSRRVNSLSSGRSPRRLQPAPQILEQDLPLEKIALPGDRQRRRRTCFADQHCQNGPSLPTSAVATATGSLEIGLFQLVVAIWMVCCVARPDASPLAPCWPALRQHFENLVT
jgi:hypothetical protein